MPWERAGFPATYFDAFPIHLLTTTSLEMMARLNPAATWDTRRFRPNFLNETEPQIKGLVEAEWEGRKLHVGSVELQCEIPTPRCGMTIQEQAGLKKDPSILRTIVKDADQNLGITRVLFHRERFASESWLSSVSSGFFA